MKLFWKEPGNDLEIGHDWYLLESTYPTLWLYSPFAERHHKEKGRLGRPLLSWYNEQGQYTAGTNLLPYQVFLSLEKDGDVISYRADGEDESQDILRVDTENGPTILLMRYGFICTFAFTFTEWQEICAGVQQLDPYGDDPYWKEHVVITKMPKNAQEILASWKNEEESDDDEDEKEEDGNPYARYGLRKGSLWYYEPAQPFERGENRISYFPSLLAGRGECWLVGVNALYVSDIRLEVQQHGKDAWKSKALTLAHFVDGTIAWQARIFFEDILAIGEHPNDFCLVDTNDVEFALPDSIREKLLAGVCEVQSWYRYALEKKV